MNENMLIKKDSINDIVGKYNDEIKGLFEDNLIKGIDVDSINKVSDGIRKILYDLAYRYKNDFDEFYVCNVDKMANDPLEWCKFNYYVNNVMLSPIGNELLDLLQGIISKVNITTHLQLEPFLESKTKFELFPKQDQCFILLNKLKDDIVQCLILEEKIRRLNRYKEII